MIFGLSTESKLKIYSNCSPFYVSNIIHYKIAIIDKHKNDVVIIIY